MADLEELNRDCTSCGEADWNRQEERKPANVPDDSDVTKHYFICGNCQAHGYVFEENGHLQFTGNLR